MKDLRSHRSRPDGVAGRPITGEGAIHDCAGPHFGLPWSDTPWDEGGGWSGLSLVSWVLCRRILAVVQAAFVVLFLVLLVVARLLHVPVAISAPGYLCPLELEAVKAPFAATLDSVCVSERAKVTIGDTLAVLDQSDFGLALSNARQEKRINDLRTSIAERDLRRERDQTAWQIARQRRQVAIDSLAADQARRVWQAQCPLDSLAPEAVMQEPYAWRQAALRLDESRLALRLAQIDSMSVRSKALELAALREKSRALESQVQYSEHRLTQTAITSPLSGTVFGRELHLRKGDSVGAGDLLLYVGRTDRWMMRCSVSDKDVAKVITGQEARVYIDALPHLVNGVFTGEVVSLATTPQSGSSGPWYEVDIALSDEHLSPLVNHPDCVYGLRGSAVIVTMRPTALRYVWLILFGRASRLVPTHVRGA